MLASSDVSAVTETTLEKNVLLLRLPFEQANMFTYSKRNVHSVQRVRYKFIYDCLSAVKCPPEKVLKLTK